MPEGILESCSVIKNKIRCQLHSGWQRSSGKIETSLSSFQERDHHPTAAMMSGAMKVVVIRSLVHYKILW